MTIAEYLAELARLPRSGRDRILTEVHEHLHDAASRHASRGLERVAAEAAAVQDFGPIGLVARGFAAQGVRRETRIATALALAAVAFFVFPLYVVPENTLPPAPWAEKPRDVLILQIVAVVLWLVAGAFAAVSAALAWTRWCRLSAPVLIAALAAIAGSAVTAAVLVERWFSAAPATPSWPLLGAPLAVGCLVACGAAARWTRSRRDLLLQD